VKGSAIRWESEPGRCTAMHGGQSQRSFALAATGCLAMPCQVANPVGVHEQPYLSQMRGIRLFRCTDVTPCASYPPAHAGGLYGERRIQARSVSDGVGTKTDVTPCVASDPPAYSGGLYGGMGRASDVVPRIARGFRTPVIFSRLTAVCRADPAAACRCRRARFCCSIHPTGS
jgi:hypothetical protein